MMAIRLAGTGGQGIQRAGVILAEAAIASGWNVACSQTYGPESRGGASRIDLILSREEIGYPRARQVDILVTLSREAHRCFVADLRPGGLLICDLSVASGTPSVGFTTYGLPILKTAKDLGHALAANVIALGALAALTEIVSRDHLAAALASHMRSTQAINQKALEAGFALGTQAGRPQAVAGGMG